MARSAAAAPSAALLLFIGTDVTFGASVRIQVAQVRPRPDRVPEGEIRPLEAARPTSTVCQKLGMEPKLPLGDRELLLLPPQPHAATRGEEPETGRKDALFQISATFGLIFGVRKLMVNIVP